ncbi:MAG: replicative DNA helicase, partial [Bacteroidaceae bacterium]|nr:replicative DNA helicase [Bacteroidaceae bacterium]
MPDNKSYTRRKRNAEQPVQADGEGHLPPQAPELEKAVLGALLLEQDAYPLVADLLKPESFYEVRNQLIYKAVLT